VTRRELHEAICLALGEDELSLPVPGWFELLDTVRGLYEAGRLAMLEECTSALCEALGVEDTELDPDLAWSRALDRIQGP